MNANTETTETVENPLALVQGDRALNPFGALTTPTAGAGAQAMAHREVADVLAFSMAARASPRDPRAAMNRILSNCARPTLAEEATYTFTKGGVEVTGATIRLAEELARSWQNIDFGWEMVARHADSSEIRAFAYDGETLVRARRMFIVKHWRDTKGGGYQLRDEREILERVASQGARLERACILAIIPADVKEAALKQCDLTLQTKGTVTPERIKTMLEAFAKFGVTREALEQRIQRQLDTLAPAQMVQLGKILNSLRDNMSRPGDWFGDVEGAGEPPPKGNEGLRQKLAKRRAEKEPPPDEETE